MADDINRVPGEAESFDMDNSLSEAGALNDQAETGDLGGGPSAGEAMASTEPLDTGFGERLDDGDLEADQAGQDESLVEKAKDKYREIMNDDHQ